MQVALCYICTMPTKFSDMEWKIGEIDGEILCCPKCGPDDLL
jgi:hypothetical protein